MEQNVSHHSRSKLVTWALGFAIVIVVNLLFNYTIALVYHEPAYNDFCPIVQIETTPTDSSKPSSYDNQQMVACQKNYDTAHSVYNQNVFGILIVLGLAVLIISAFISIEVLSAGFSWAGVLALIIASMRYWSDAGNLIRVLLLVIALGLLVWISIKKFNK
jgi:hypothetical protein